MKQDDEQDYNRWARFRFSIIGPLLAAPSERGELREELERLAAKTWRHPVTGEAKTFGISTLERWYYAARAADRDPVAALRRRVRKDAGTRPSLNLDLLTRLREQYGQHKSWSYQLHVDNLAVLVEQAPEIGPMPSYSSVNRYLKSQGLFRMKRRRSVETAGTAIAQKRLEQLEVRSYEAEYVNGLWHLDFHNGSRKVITPKGDLVTPVLFATLDDHSRLACHAQWYLEDERTEDLVHGLSQAIQKRGLPRSLMSDNGGPMIAAETKQGLLDLSIVHETTLPYSPYQNGKQEHFWTAVEGRLVAMLEDVKDLTIELLNEATQAWVELEYNQGHHSEIGTTPLKRFIAGRDVGRASPSSEELRQAFRMICHRTVRRSDGTISLEARRFEIPSRYRHFQHVVVRYARWDLRLIDMVDPRTGKILCRLYPQDKIRNADGIRRRIEPISMASTELPKDEIAPLLKKLMAVYSATGLPPAYVPKIEPAADNEETTR
jgi:transposase InsO family protein